MYDEFLCSLCVVVKVKSGMPMLYRVADLENGHLIPFVRDETAPYEHYNKDTIYHPPTTIPQMGHVSLWDWNSKEDLDGKFKQHSTLHQDLSWTEHIKYDEVSSLFELKELLITGVEYIPPDHDYLIEYDMIGSIHHCVFCSGHDFISAGKTSKLKDTIRYLSIYAVKDADIAMIDPWKVSGTIIRYHCSVPLGEPEHRVPVRTPAAIVKERILSRIKRYSPEMSKADRRSIRHFLETIPNSTLVEDIAMDCQCEFSTAQSYIDEFLLDCEQYFTNEDIGTDLLSRIITNDSEIALRFQSLVRENWEEEQSEHINAMQAEVDKREIALRKIEEQTHTQEQTLAGILSQVSLAEEALKRTEIIRQEQINRADQTAEQIRDKINEAQEDVAAFFSEYAMFAGRNQGIYSEKKETAIKLICTPPLSDNPYQIENIKDLYECLCDNLEIAGVADNRKSILAAYLMAAYANKTPLIVAGYGAISIVDALSTTIHNTTADRAYCFGKTDISPILELTGPKIVAVYDAFHGSCMSEMLNFSASSSHYCCFLFSTSQEMAIESKGVFDYALPVFTELFIEKPAINSWEGSLCTIDLSVTTNEKIKVPIPKRFISAFTYLRCKRLLEYVAGVLDDHDIFDSILLQAFPIMASLGLYDELEKLFDTAKLSDDEKDELKNLLGESE